MSAVRFCDLSVPTWWHIAWRVSFPVLAHSFDLQPAQRDLMELVVGFFDKHLRGGKP
jgi:hypothetical protein